MSLYADDLLLYISNPNSSIPSIMSILDQFGKYSGYKLNYQKSELFPINAAALRMPPTLFPFRRMDNGFKYLGIFITKSFPKMFNENFLPLLDRCKADFKRWSTLPFSLAGRINLIKMSILPKFLYLFQHIPVFIRKSFFTKLDQVVSSFLWGNKARRIKKAYLQQPKSMGGMALPNFLHYYWASNIQKLLFWLRKDNIPLWAQMETLSSQESLSSLVCSALPLSYSLSPMPSVSHTLKIWTQFRSHFSLNRPSCSSPIYRNHRFKPSCTDNTFLAWLEKGIESVGDLYSNGIFSSFSDLSQRFNLPRSHLFRYFQIRHFLQKQFPEFPHQPTPSKLDSILSLNSNARGLVSVSVLYSENYSIRPETLHSLKAAWVEDLGPDMTDDMWAKVLELVHTSSICARHGLLQCKIVYRTHYTNARLAKIFPGRSDACNRCGHSPADLLHMLWACPRLSDYWSAIFKSLSDVSGVDISPDPFTALFGASSVAGTPPHFDRVISFSTLLARRIILMKWKHALPPTHNKWITDVLYFLKLEKIRFSLRGTSRNFEKTWLPFLEYTRTLTMEDDNT